MESRTTPRPSSYRELAPAVLGYFRSQRAPEPEDLLGEVFLHVARNIRRCHGDAEARRRWVFTIAHHRLVDAWRRRAARPITTDQPPPDRPVVDASLDEIDPSLQAAIDTLTEDQRVVVLLRFVADLSLHDVARITHRPVGAVKALQHRGLAALERALGDGQIWAGIVPTGETDPAQRRVETIPAQMGVRR